MSAGWSRRRVFKGDSEAGLGCRWEGLEEVFKGGSRCRLEENFKVKGGARCQREGLEEAFTGGLRCKVAAFSGSKLLSKDLG